MPSASAVRNGASCAGACWALMLPMLLIGQGQLPAMIAVTLFSLAERLEDPAPLAWRWRGAGKALRIATAQMRMRLARQEPDLAMLNRMRADPAWLARFKLAPQLIDRSHQR